MSEQATKQESYRPMWVMLDALYGQHQDALETLREMDDSELERVHRAAAYLTDMCESEREDWGEFEDGDE